jgi:hypothetical protein
LRTYDRKILKPDLHRMQTAITSPMAQYTYSALVPASQATGQSWKYTFTTPAANWFASNFNDQSWTNGLGGFGAGGLAGLAIRTTWNTADIWLRRTFNPGALTSQQRSNLMFKVFHDEDCEIYINGVLAASATGYVSAYAEIAMNSAGQNAIVANANNVLAVHCHQTSGGQGIDVGIDSRTLTVPAPPVFVPNWLENGSGLTAEYFSGTNLSNLAFARVDPNINFNWGNGSPGGGVPSDSFSVRWTGKIQPRYTEGYTFHLTVNNGCRLWIDGQLIIDKWRENTNSDVTGSIALIGGQQYDLRVEYYHAGTLADAVLEWTSASQSREIVPQGVLFPANRPPVLGAVSDVTITAGQTLIVTNSATDADVPAQSLTWSLTGAAAGASINPTNGLFTWRPTILQSPSTNLFAVTVTDSGIPTLSATQSFSVTVLRPNPPTFVSPTFSGNAFQTFIAGSAGPDYFVYATTNLASDWQLLLNTNPIALPFLFTDPDSTNFEHRFYRILLGP